MRRRCGRALVDRGCGAEKVGDGWGSEGEGKGSIRVDCYARRYRDSRFEVSRPGVAKRGRKDLDQLEGRRSRGFLNTEEKETADWRPTILYRNPSP